jgi:hypothetical protein
MGTDPAWLTEPDEAAALALFDADRIKYCDNLRELIETAYTKETQELAAHAATLDLPAAVDHATAVLARLCAYDEAHDLPPKHELIALGKRVGEEDMSLAFVAAIAALAPPGTIPLAKPDEQLAANYDAWMDARRKLSETGGMTPDVFAFMRREKRSALRVERAKIEAEIVRLRAMQTAWNRQVEELFTSYGDLARLQTETMRANWARDRDPFELSLMTVHMINNAEMMLMTLMNVPVNLRAGLQTQLSLPPSTYVPESLASETGVYAMQTAAAGVDQRETPAEGPLIFPPDVPMELLKAVVDEASYNAVLVYILDTWKGAPSPAGP